MGTKSGECAELLYFLPGIKTWHDSRVHHEKCWAERSTGWNQDCWRNISKFNYADDTTLMAESKEDLKSLLMKLKEESENISF